MKQEFAQNTAADSNPADNMDELRDLKRKGERAAKIETMLLELEDELEEAEMDAEERLTQLEREEADVKNLKGLGFSRFLARISGDYYERLDQEEQQAAEAAIYYNQAVDRIEDIKLEIQQLKQEQADCQVSAERYHWLLKAKQKESQNKGGGTAGKIAALQEAIDQCKRNQRELQEAISAGEAAKASLLLVIESLNSASGWGIFDLVGGGVLTTLVKHSHIDEAKRQVAAAENNLRRFHTELLDTPVSAQLQIDTDGFMKFADFFMDGFLIDFFMQTKINTARENVQSVMDSVEEYLLDLNELRETGLQEEERLQLQLEDLILGK
ncbi:MAG: hypothetical protein LLG09_05745 [Negativicutes bacterium]|nr:hypothetical protein [Negativicutes bacterium]